MSGQNRRTDTTPVVDVVLPTYEQCEEAVKNGSATELERFIYHNEPAGPSDEGWRASLAAVLSENIEEDRRAR